MRRLATTLVLGMILVAGCGPTRAPAGPVAGPIVGPAEVIEKHNAWADSIPHIWARTALMMNFPSGNPEDGRLQYDLDGHVFLQKPESLYVHGEVLGKDVFCLGMNAERFWLWIGPRVNTIWTGRRGGPGERRFIISPEDLMVALGLFRIELDREAKAVFVAQERHYVLSEEREFAGTRVPMRRIWFDRHTLRPVRVDLFDDAGQRLLMAELLKYERIGQVEMCTVYRARFYAAADEMDLVLRLNSVRLDKPPAAGVFKYRVPSGAVERDLDTQPDTSKEPEYDKP